MKKLAPFLIIVGVLVIAIGGGALLYRSQADDKPKPVANTSTPRTPVPASAGALPMHVRGSHEAPVTLEEFGDFECPSCGRLYKELKQIESEYGSNLQV